MTIKAIKYSIKILPLLFTSKPTKTQLKDTGSIAYFMRCGSIDITILIKPNRILKITAFSL